MWILAMLAVWLVSSTPALAGTDSANIYATQCAACHGADRLGLTGPALLPDNLGRLSKSAALATIRDGKPATQMPAFGTILTATTLNALVEWVYTVPTVVPPWRESQIVQSHLKHDVAVVRKAPVTDPLNLFVIVETGDHHVTIFDGDALKPIHRFASRFALHGGAKFSPDGRYTYLASRDGWVSKFDLWSLQTVAEIRVGINTRNIAVSPDGRYVLAGNFLPATLVFLSAEDLSLLQVIPVETATGPSRVSAVYAAKPRSSFVVALKDAAELWELPLPGGEKAPFFVANAANESLRRATNAVPIRKVNLPYAMDDFFFTPDFKHAVGANRAAERSWVIDIETARHVTDLALSGMPHLASGITWRSGKRHVLASPDLRQAKISVFDLDTWLPVTDIVTLGGGFFLRGHERTPYVWADVFFGEHKDAMHVIDKNSLSIVKTLRPEPGKISAHVEFDRHGKYALVSIWEDQGYLVVYDAATLTEVKRIPMRKPVGKYNVYNKITGSEGTSP